MATAVAAAPAQSRKTETYTDTKRRDDVRGLNIAAARAVADADAVRSGWRPAITIKQILVGKQDMLDQPNPADPAQTDGYHIFIQDKPEYKRRVHLQAKQYPALL
ncbi:hypothetical protein ABZP36_010079 [Zizania latifolia]